MSTFKVALTDTVFPSLEPAKEILKKNRASLVQAESPTKEEIIKVASDADAVLVTFAKLETDIVRELKKCRVIGRFGIGVDNIDIKTATNMGIQVTFCPNYCLDEVSDHALGLLLTLARKILSGNELVQNGRWEMRALAPLRRVRGRTLGLVGFGKIAQTLTTKAQALGLRVIAYDPYVEKGTLESSNVENMEFKKLLESSDFISIHAPLTKETRHLFDSTAFGYMKQSAYVINTSRGPVIDESALIEALNNGIIAGAALDVTETEPPGKNTPLINREDIILTPHAAFYSEDALHELQTSVTEDVIGVLNGANPLYPANYPNKAESG